MNFALSSTTHFTHLDLSTGQRANISLSLEPEKQKDTLLLLLQAQRESRPINWAAGMCIMGDLSKSGNGIAIVGLCAATDMCNGRIKAGDSVYSFAVAISSRAQQLAWHTLSNLYVNSLTRDGAEGGALGDMPGDHPWAAGFMWPATKHLGENGRMKLVHYARIAAASAVNRLREVYVGDANALTQHELPEAGEDEAMFG